MIWSFLRAFCYRDVLLRGLLHFLYQGSPVDILSLTSMINFGSAADKWYLLHLLTNE